MIQARNIVFERDRLILNVDKKRGEDSDRSTFKKTSIYFKVNLNILNIYLLLQSSIFYM